MDVRVLVCVGMLVLMGPSDLSAVLVVVGMFVHVAVDMDVRVAVAVRVRGLSLQPYRRLHRFVQPRRGTRYVLPGRRQFGRHLLPPQV